MAEGRTSKAETLRQIAAARAQGARDRRLGRRAVGARYDAATGRVLLELSNGFLFGFPVSRIAALTGANASELAAVQVSPGGGALCWPALDVDLSVPGLVLSSVGRDAKLSELARIAGKSTSRAKAAAARANGKKGGRPRKAAT